MEWSALSFHAVCNTAAMLTSTIDLEKNCFFSRSMLPQPLLVRFTYTVNMHCTVLYMYSAEQRSHVRSASYGFSLRYTRCAKGGPKGGRMVSDRPFCPSFKFRVSQN